MKIFNGIGNFENNKENNTFENKNVIEKEKCFYFYYLIFN